MKIDTTTTRLHTLLARLDSLARTYLDVSGNAGEQATRISLKRVTGFSTSVKVRKEAGPTPLVTGHAAARIEAAKVQLTACFDEVFAAVGGPKAPFACTVLSFDVSKGLFNPGLEITLDGVTFTLQQPSANHDTTLPEIAHKVACLLYVHKCLGKAQAGGQSPCYRVSTGPSGTDRITVRAASPALAGIAAVAYRTLAFRDTEQCLMGPHSGRGVQAIQLLKADPYRAHAAALAQLSGAVDAHLVTGAFAHACLDDAFPATTPAEATPVAPATSKPRRSAKAGGTAKLAA